MMELTSTEIIVYIVLFVVVIALFASLYAVSCALVAFVQNRLEKIFGTREFVNAIATLRKVDFDDDFREDMKVFISKEGKLERSMRLNMEEILEAYYIVLLAFRKARVFMRANTVSKRAVDLWLSAEMVRVYNEVVAPLSDMMLHPVGVSKNDREFWNKYEVGKDTKLRCGRCQSEIHF